MTAMVVLEAYWLSGFFLSETTTMKTNEPGTIYALSYGDIHGLRENRKTLKVK